jgi:hypothetical protein
MKKYKSTYVEALDHILEKTKQGEEITLRDISVALAGKGYAALFVLISSRTFAHKYQPGLWIADSEHHRMGGVLVHGALVDRDCDCVAMIGEASVNWFAAGPELTRLYLVMPARQLQATGVAHSFDALIAFADAYMPEGALDDAQQAGPIGFFPNNDIWSSRIAGNGAVLVGDAAGAPDPTQGHGTALLYRDVRVLSELLLAEPDWERAAEEFACRRQRYFEPILLYDRWSCLLRELGPEADRLREGHERAKAADPTLGGYELIAARGPDGLSTNDAARRAYFGES